MSVLPFLQDNLHQALLEVTDSQPLLLGHKINVITVFKLFEFIKDLFPINLI